MGVAPVHVAVHALRRARKVVGRGQAYRAALSGGVSPTHHPQPPQTNSCAYPDLLSL